MTSVYALPTGRRRHSRLARLLGFPADRRGARMTLDEKRARRGSWTICGQQFDPRTFELNQWVPARRLVGDLDASDLWVPWPVLNRAEASTDTDYPRISRGAPNVYSLNPITSPAGKKGRRSRRRLRDKNADQGTTLDRAKATFGEWTRLGEPFDPRSVELLHGFPGETPAHGHGR